jgi:hypothetical protein
MCPHEPQLSGLFASVTQAPEHIAIPDGQAHLPPVQCCPAGQL